MAASKQRFAAAVIATACDHQTAGQALTRSSVPMSTRTRRSSSPSCCCRASILDTDEAAAAAAAARSVYLAALGRPLVARTLNTH